MVFRAAPFPARRACPPRRFGRRAAWWARFQLLCALLLCDAAQALTHDALPSGAQVRAGDVDITSDARGMRIRQVSEHAIVDWRSFDIGRDASVRIFQHTNAALLNRVRGDTPSAIAGELSATSIVHLVNPNGIHIAATGSVSAAGFVAATLDMTDADFLRRELRFGTPTRSGTGTVSLDGTITTEPGGFAALLGHRVEQRGMIRTPLGQTGLGAGRVIRLTPGDDTFLEVTLARVLADAGAPGNRNRAAIVMSGTVEADGGLVQIDAPMPRARAAAEAVNLGGVVRTRNAMARTGAILVHGKGGIVRLAGRLDASSNDMRGTRGTGGIVELNGLQVSMEEGSIDVSGELGGGCAWVVAHRAEGEDGEGGERGIRAAGRIPVPGRDDNADPLLFIDAGSRIHVEATYQGEDGDARLVSAGRMVVLAHGHAYDAPAAATANRLRIVARTAASNAMSSDTPRRLVPAALSPPMLRSSSPPAAPSVARGAAELPHLDLDALAQASAPMLPRADSRSALRVSVPEPASWQSSLQSSMQSSPAVSSPSPAGWHASPGALAPQRARWHSSPDASAPSRASARVSPAVSEPLPTRGQASSPALSESQLSSWQPSPIALQSMSPHGTPSPTASVQRQAISRARTAHGHRPDEAVSWMPSRGRTWSGSGMPPPGRGS